MELTWLGGILLVVGALVFVVAPKWLHILTVFAIPFTATSLLNTRSGVPVSPLHFFGVLFVLRRMLSSHTPRPVKLSRPDRSTLLLILFLTVVVVSMVMPLLISGTVVVSSNQLADLYDEPLRLTAHNIMNPLPVVFGVVLSLCLIKENDTTDKIRSTIRVYVASGVFVSLWGYFQFLCNSVLHIEYPAFLFNNAIPDSMRGYASQIDIGGDLYFRVSSVTHEASIFSKYALTVLAIMVVSVWLRRPLFSKARDKMILSILVGVLILTTSATAYWGIICLLAVAALILGRLHLIACRRAISVAWVGTMVVLLYSTLPVVRDVVDALILLKFQSGSALERALSIVQSWEYFTQYPVLGVGWAVVTSHSLLTFLLVSTGIVGFATFCALLFYVIRHSLETLVKIDLDGGSSGGSVLALGAGLVVGLITLLVMGILTGLEFYLGYFYFLVSMLIAFNVATRSQRDGGRAEASWKKMPQAGQL